MISASGIVTIDTRAIPYILEKNGVKILDIKFTTFNGTEEEIQVIFTRYEVDFTITPSPFKIFGEIMFNGDLHPIVFSGEYSEMVAFTQMGYDIETMLDDFSYDDVE